MTGFLAGLVGSSAVLLTLRFAAFSSFRRFSEDGPSFVTCFRLGACDDCGDGSGPLLMASSLTTLMKPSQSSVSYVRGRMFWSQTVDMVVVFLTITSPYRRNASTSTARWFPIRLPPPLPIRLPAPFLIRHRPAHF